MSSSCATLDELLAAFSCAPQAAGRKNVPAMTMARTARRWRSRVAKSFSLDCLLRGPRMWLAGFRKDKIGHEQSEGRDGCVAHDGHPGEFFGSAEAAAVDVHVQQVGTRDHAEETEHDERHQRGPDPE